MSEDIRKEIEDAMAALKEKVEGDDAEAIKAAAQTLTEAAMKLGEAIYKAQAEETAAAEAADGEAAAKADAKAEDDGVVDADFTEVNDDDRKAG